MTQELEQRAGEETGGGTGGTSTALSANERLPNQGREESLGGEARPESDRAARVPDTAPEAGEIAEQLKARQNKQEFYWKRQAEKLNRQMEEERKAKDEEVSLLRAQHEEALAKLNAAQDKEARLKAIAEAGLPADLAQLVPESGEAEVKEYIEKLKPLADKLRRGNTAGILTNPARNAGGDGARLNQLAAAAKRGDKNALREYAHLREKISGGR